MKAVRLSEYGGPLVFDDVPTPAIARDEILLKINEGLADVYRWAACVCGHAWPARTVRSQAHFLAAGWNAHCSHASRMFGVCFLVLCLAQSPQTSERVTFSHDTRGETRTERIFSYERQWMIAGFVQQASPDAAFGGVLPLRLNMFNGHVTMDAGVIVATADVPGTGTRANFMTRAQFHLSKRFAVTYWHWSNAGLSSRNPGVDVLGASVRLRVHTARADATHRDE
jgi:hypothetical protein